MRLVANVSDKKIVPLSPDKRIPVMYNRIRRIFAGCVMLERCNIGLRKNVPATELKLRVINKDQQEEFL